MIRRILLVLAVLVPAGSPCLAKDAAPLPRSAPEAQGVSSSALLAFVEAADTTIDSFHSVMVVRHGHVVAEGWWTPYDRESRHELYSLSKSFTSTAVGLAVAEGKLSVDDAVLKFFPDDAPAQPGANLKSMRVSDLLRMSTGHQSEPGRTGGHWAKAFLAHPVPFKPGTHFLYNTSGTYMLSAIVQKATGQTVLDYLRPRLFGPLGIEDPTWGTSPQGVSLGGYGLSVRTEDIAKFGQLYLQKGKWNGKQVVPAEWVAAATARQTSNGSNPKSDWDQGYGYQFWRSRHGAYRGDGAFGQYCVVLPGKDAVVAITSGVKDMQAVLDLVWDKLLPALKDESLPENELDRKALDRRLSGLTLRPQEGPGAPGKTVDFWGKSFAFPKNDPKLESLRLEPGDGSDAAVLVARVDGSEHRIACGRGVWKKGRMTVGGFPEQPAAASGAWTDDHTFAAKICLYETPFTVKLRLKFGDGKLAVESETNVGFGPSRASRLEGKVEGGQASGSKADTPQPGSGLEAQEAGPKLSETQEKATRSAARGHDFARWEKEIAAFAEADRTNPPPKGGVLFTGSSTIRMWTSLARDFPNHKVINRGFGGSEIVDATYYADRIIFPFEPKQIFLRAGGNDIHAGRLPGEVATDFSVFVETVHARLPQTEIVYIAVNPAPARWGENDKYVELNRRIREIALYQPRVTVVPDTYGVGIDPAGQPQPGFFLDDQLHFNSEGYRVLADRVRPFLMIPPK